MADRDDMIRKIEACLRLANDPGATEAEKQLAADRAKDLMSKYDVEEATLYLRRREAGEQDDIVLLSFQITKSDAQGDQVVPEQRLMLAHYIAMEFRCRNIVEDKHPSADVDTGAVVPGGKFLTVCGFKRDAETVRDLYRSLTVDLIMASVGEQQKGKNYLVNFAQGYVDRIHVRLQSLRRNATKQTETGGDGSMALVLRDKSAAVTDFFDKLWPPSSVSSYRSKGKGTKDAAARARGAAAADAADLSSDGSKVGRGTKGAIGR